MRILQKLNEFFDGLIKDEKEAEEAVKWLAVDLSQFGY